MPHTPRSRAWVACTAIMASGLVPTLCLAQTGTQSKSDAVVIVDGVVREVYQSLRRASTDYVVQIRVQASTLGKAAPGQPRLPAPAPGDDVYVHLYQAREGGARNNSGHRQIPSEGASIRAYLYPRSQGGWSGTLPDWFDTTQADKVANNDVEPPADASDPASPSSSTTSGLQGLPRFFNLLGLEGQLVNASGKVAYQALTIKPNSAGALAGIEPRDAIVALNGTALTESASAIIEAIRKNGAKLTASVIDHRTGKVVPVEIDLASIKGLEQPPAASSPESTLPEIHTEGGEAAGSRDLGIDAEPVSLGLRQALRVTAVTPGSLAQKAGIEPGDVIVDADGLPVSSPASLARALQDAVGTLTLNVRDVKTNKDTPVEIPIGNAAPGVPAGKAPAPRSPAIGLAADPVFVGGRVALKITDVQPGTPGQKAGFEKGDVIVDVNGASVESIDQIATIARKAGPKLKVTVLDIRTRKTAVVDLDLNTR